MIYTTFCPPQEHKLKTFFIPLEKCLNCSFFKYNCHADFFKNISKLYLFKVKIHQETYQIGFFNEESITKSLRRSNLNFRINPTRASFCSLLSLLIWLDSPPLSGNHGQQLAGRARRARDRVLGTLKVSLPSHIRLGRVFRPAGRPMHAWLPALSLDDHATRTCNNFPLTVVRRSLLGN